VSGGTAWSFYDGDVSERTQSETPQAQWGPVARVALAAGVFASAVSVGLFIHTISQLASPIVCAVFIAAGIVGRQRAATPAGRLLAYGALAGGVVAFVVSLVLAGIGK
jgi:hypothetical protein